jgi:hypothetical protein
MRCSLGAYAAMYELRPMRGSCGRYVRRVGVEAGIVRKAAITASATLARTLSGK